jgi:hypothetical protein
MKCGARHEFAEENAYLQPLRGYEPNLFLRR